jgi:hypothetical protein
MRFVLALALISTACNPFGCDERKQTLEIDTRSPFFDAEFRILQQYRAQGWDCPVTDISGSRTLYTCTKCD